MSVLSRRLPRIGAGLLLFAVAAALLAPMLAYPFGRDQGLFACAADVIRRGGLLYRDVWDLKPPGVYYLYWLSLAAFGRSMLAPRLLDLLLTLATAGSLALIGGRLLSLRAGIAGAFLFLGRYAMGFDYWHTAQGDGFASLPLSLAALSLAAAERRRSWWWAAASGALIGSAVVIKFTLAIFLALPLIVLLAARAEPLRTRLARGAAYLLGCLVVIAAMTVWLWRAGVLKQMLEILFAWNSHYAAIRAPAPAPIVILYQTGRFLFGGQYLVLKLIGLLGLVGAADLGLRREAGRLRWLLPAWLAAMLAQVWAQGKYFEYHWVPALPPLGLLAGWGLAVVWRLLRAGVRSPRLARALAEAGAAVLLASFASAYWAHFKTEIGYAAGGLPASEFLSQFKDRSDFSLTADLQVASFLKAHTPPGAPIFIWGFEPIVYFLADRPPASRFLSQQPLVTPWSPPEWRRELIGNLEQRRPAYLLVLHHDFMPWVTMRPYDSAGELPGYPELLELLRNNYHSVGRIEDFDLWERNGAPVGMSGRRASCWNADGDPAFPHLWPGAG
jgi:hypothetical protein